MTALIAGPHLHPILEVSDQTLDAGDAHISLWSLWWTRHAVELFSNPFWTDYLFFPRGTSLAFHSYPFIYGLLSIPIQHAFSGKEALALAFNTLLFGSFVVSGLATYLLASRLTGNRRAAWVAGLIYTFAPFHVLNSSRLAVAAIELIPIYILAFLRLQERPTWPRAFLLSCALAIAYYNAIEYAFYLALLSLTWSAWGLISRGPGWDRRLVGRLFGAAGGFLILAGPLLVQQVKVATTEGNSIGGRWDEAVRWSPALLSFVTPSRAQPLYGSLFSAFGEYADGVTSGMRSETALGTATLVFIGLALSRGKKDGRHLFAITGAAFLVLSLGPYLKLSGRWTTSLPLPYAALYKVLPPLRAVQEPTRMFPMVLLMAAILAAYSLRDLLEITGRSARRQSAIFILAIVSVSFESLTAWPWSSTRHVSVAVSAPFYEELARDPGEFSIMDLNDSGNALETVIAQPTHAKRTTERQGFIPRAAAIAASGPARDLEEAFQHPKTLIDLSSTERHAKLEEIRRALREARTRYILFSLKAGEGTRGAWLSWMARALHGTLEPRGGLLIIDLAALLGES